MALDFTIPYMPKNIKSGDFDGDGVMDLIVGHGMYAFPDSSSVGQISVIWNAGLGNMSVIANRSFIGAGFLIAFTQLDNAGGDDIAVLYINGNNSYMRVYYNGDFTQNHDYLLSEDNLAYLEGGSNTAVGDIDNDGYLDVVIHSGSSKWCFLKNLGNLEFAPAVWYDDPSTINGFAEIACGDFNEDGLCDVVGLGWYSYVYYSHGTPWFTEQLLDGPIYNATMVVADMNYDGMDDITISEWLGNGLNRFHSYQNLPGESFEYHQQTIDLVGWQPAIAGDIDGDELTDIIEIYDPFSFEVYLNDGDWTFTDYSVLTEFHGENEQHACLGCFDNNRTPDIAIFRLYNPTINLTILFNDGRGAFFPNPITENNDHTAITQTHRVECYPNPCRDGVTIKNCSEKLSAWKINVYNLKGQVVKSTTSEEQTFYWDLKDDHKKQVSSGIYILGINFGNHNNVVSKIMVIN
jgi:hypothetical protein